MEKVSGIGIIFLASLLYWVGYKAIKNQRLSWYRYLAPWIKRTITGKEAVSGGRQVIAIGFILTLLGVCVIIGIEDDGRIGLMFIVSIIAALYIVK